MDHPTRATVSDVCCWKGELVLHPWFLGFDHGSKRGEQFEHGHDESGLVGLTQGSQLQVRRSTASRAVCE